MLVYVCGGGGRVGLGLGLGEGVLEFSETGGRGDLKWGVVVFEMGGGGLSPL